MINAPKVGSCPPLQTRRASKYTVKRQEREQAVADFLFCSSNKPWY